MDNVQTLKTYHAILTMTGKMLTAAQNNEWDQLIVFEQECKLLTELLVDNNPEPILDKELLQKKVRIIHQILADDAQIKAITEPWMEKLQDLLESNNRAINLQQTYQSINNG